MMKNDLLEFENTNCQQLMAIINQAHARLNQINKSSEWGKADPDYRKYIREETLHLVLRMWQFEVWAKAENE